MVVDIMASRIISMQKPKIICGIKCSLSNRGCALFHKVLKQIQQKRPNDFKKLQRLVQVIKRRKWNDGTLGKVERRNDIFAGDGPMYEIGHPIVVCLDERQPDTSLIATIAHELGHACSTRDDMERRGIPDSNYASELIADWYAYKWGFGRVIAGVRLIRDAGHHGPVPGSWIELGVPLPGGYEFHRYLISRRFRARKIGKPRFERTTKS
jgi:hypothetical protein